MLLDSVDVVAVIMLDVIKANVVFLCIKISLDEFYYFEPIKIITSKFL